MSLENDIHNFLMLQHCCGPDILAWKANNEEAQKLTVESYFAHKQNAKREQVAQKPLLTLPSLETVMGTSLIGSFSSERLQVGGSFKHTSYGQSVRVKRPGYNGPDPICPHCHKLMHFDFDTRSFDCYSCPRRISLEALQDMWSGQ